MNVPLNLNAPRYSTFGNDEEANHPETIVNDVISRLQKKSWFGEMNSSLTDRIEILKEEDLHNLCQQIMDKDPLCIDRFLKTVSLNTLQRTLDNTTFERHQEVITNMVACKQLTRHVAQGSLVSYVSKNPNFADKLILAFELINSNQGPNNLWEATQMLQSLTMLFFIPFFITLVIYQVESNRIPNYIDPFVIFGTAVSMIFMVITSFKIYKSILLIPVQVKPLRNYSKDAIEGKLEQLLGRDDIIESIFLCWKATHSSVRQHPLLVGPAGVGKFVILLETARRIALGQFPQAL